MVETKETQLAWQFIAETNVSVFLTGKAGTGKTTFLHELKENPPKRMAVVAPTGVAAINAQGMTIHSFFQLPLGPHIPGTDSRRTEEHHFRMSKEKKNILRTLDLLVIDEISMVRCDLLDSIDEVLRKYKDRFKPFGGVQLLMIGDLQQLAPVAKETEWDMLKTYYDTPYFFGSKALQQIQYVTLELTTIYRQSDETFINLLAKVRDNCLDSDAISQLNGRYVPDFKPSENEDWIRLTTHNKFANDYNYQQLSQLPDEEIVEHAHIEGNFPETAYPAEENLRLKIGAQVMFLRNDTSYNHLYYNGKIGVITSVSPDKLTIVSKEDGSEIELTRATWENTKYVINPETKEIEEQCDGTFTQFPIRLAWAITIHKSQGLTFDHAVLDVNESFAHGQTYVALSRCRTLTGLVLTNPINARAIISDQHVNSFISSELERAQQAKDQFPEMQFQYYLQLLNELFSFENLKSDLLYLLRVSEEYLYKSHPDFTKEVKDASDSFSQQIIDVANRFQSQYLSLLYSDKDNYLSNQHLKERIHSASEYFSEKLMTIFEPIFTSSSISIGNQAVKEQFNNALGAFTLSFKVKYGTMLACSHNGFSVSSYLSDKVHAVLYVVAPKKTPKSRKKDAESSKQELQPLPKPAKKSTSDITLEMYQSGISLPEIAKQRDLKLQTIETHIAQQVEKGRIAVDEIVFSKRQNLIRRIVSAFDHAYGLSDIKALLPSDYTYLEIKCVIAEMNKKQN